MKAKYGGKLIFHGGVENQHTLPIGAADDVSQKTEICLNELSPAGYIPCSCHFTLAYTPRENILSLIKTVQD